MRRTLGILAGVVAAVIGTLVLMSVVENNTEQTDTEQQQLASILVVTTQIARQTTVESISANVEVTQIPIDLVAPGAVASLADIPTGQVAATDLLPGEQLLLDRFVDPRTLSTVNVPEGLQEVTILLPTPQRVLGGSLAAGDTVGVIFSFVPTEGLPTTQFILHNTLVTSVQFSPGDALAIEQQLTPLPNAVNRYPAEGIMVTLAVSSVDAARLVFAAEFGALWLTQDNALSTISEDVILDIEDFVPPVTP